MPTKRVDVHFRGTVPAEVLRAICIILEQDGSLSTLRSMTRCSESAYEIASAVLYRHIHITSDAVLKHLLEGLHAGASGDASRIGSVAPVARRTRAAVTKERTSRRLHNLLRTTVLTFNCAPSVETCDLVDATAKRLRQTAVFLNVDKVCFGPDFDAALIFSRYIPISETSDRMLNSVQTFPAQLARLAAPAYMCLELAPWENGEIAVLARWTHERLRCQTAHSYIGLEASFRLVAPTAGVLHQRLDIYRDDEDEYRKRLRQWSPASPSSDIDESIHPELPSAAGWIRQVVEAVQTALEFGLHDKPKDLDRRILHVFDSTFPADQVQRAKDAMLERVIQNCEPFDL